MKEIEERKKETRKGKEKKRQLAHRASNSRCNGGPVEKPHLHCADTLGRGDSKYLSELSISTVRRLQCGIGEQEDEVRQGRYPFVLASFLACRGIWMLLLVSVLWRPCQVRYRLTQSLGRCGGRGKGRETFKFGRANRIAQHSVFYR